MRLISSGITARTELQSNFQDDISGYLARLENVYRLIERAEPIGESGAKRKRIRFERSPAHSPSFRRKGGVKQAGEALSETDHMLLDGCMLITVNLDSDEDSHLLQRPHSGLQRRA